MSLFTTHFKQYERIPNESQPCSVDQCSNLPNSICCHCDQHFCHDHSNEHENRCNQTLRHLTETIDKLSNRITSVKPYFLNNLQQWRSESYHTIDRCYEKKYNDIIEKKQIILNKELDDLRNQLITEIKNEWNEINHDIQLIEVKLTELEHLRLTIRPLIIEDNLVTLQQLFPLPHASHTIHIKSGNESSIGSNEKYLLVEREGKYLCLIDRNFVIVNEILFNHNDIHSIFWSSSINRFIIITFKKIFTLENTMILEECPIPSNIDWWRGTCSNDTLYLSSAEWGSSIYEFDLRSTFQFVKTWHTPVTCERDEIICDLKYNNGFLAIPIFNKHKEQSRFDLRLSTTLDCIWTINIHGRCRCCSINGDQWLVMDHDDCRFFHISADGQLLKIDKYEYHQRLEDVTTWNQNNIVVLTKKTINIHELH
ncbi:unnamed protein product [Adineta steineri]|uniref:B box-type domain-containing protein n=1 Tax=Adineta steineri TaxID=433720 RepID=A0A818TGY5_9BILA|nr:unnamed protein product [Adineta steineri]